MFKINNRNTRNYPVLRFVLVFLLLTLNIYMPAGIILIPEAATERRFLKKKLFLNLEIINRDYLNFDNSWSTYVKKIF